MRRIVSTLLLCSLSVSMAMAQSSDIIKEEIAITKAVINQLFAKRSEGDVYLRDGETKVTYYPGYGFLINAPKLNDGTAMYYFGSETVSINGRTYPAPNIDSLVTVRTKKINELIRQYYANYARLITTLQPGEKVRINYDHWMVNNQFANPLASSSKNNKGTSNFKGLYAELTYDQLESYRQGKINKDDLIKKIEVKTGLAGQQVDETEFSIMANILKNLLEKDKSYNGYSQVKYNYLPGLGVVFNCNIYRSRPIYFKGNGFAPGPDSPPGPTNQRSMPRGKNGLRVQNGNDEMELDEKKQDKKDKRSEKVKTDSNGKTKVVTMGKNYSSSVECDEEELKQTMRESEIESKEMEKEIAEISRQATEFADAVTKITIQAFDDGMRMIDENAEDVPLDSIAENLKAHLLRYGSTLGSLKDGEMIIVKFEDFSYDEVTLSLPVNVIRRLERKEITQEEAIRMVIMSK